MTKYQNKYRVESSRKQDWDYGRNGFYFITIVTKNRIRYFGNIQKNSMNLSDIGGIASKFWFEIPDHFPFVKLDAFVVMPDHVHGIIQIDKIIEYVAGVVVVEARHALPLQQPHTLPLQQQHTLPLHPHPRFRNPGKNNMSTIIGSYKSTVSRHAHKINPDLNWQSRFHDRIVRDKYELERIRKYIERNPLKWAIHKEIFLSDGKKGKPE